jgi:hypothetical protein
MAGSAQAAGHSVRNPGFEKNRLSPTHSGASAIAFVASSLHFRNKVTLRLQWLSAINMLTPGRPMSVRPMNGEALRSIFPIARRSRAWRDLRISPSVPQMALHSQAEGHHSLYGRSPPQGDSGIVLRHKKKAASNRSFTSITVLSESFFGKNIPLCWRPR